MALLWTLKLAVAIIYVVNTYIFSALVAVNPGSLVKQTVAIEFFNSCIVAQSD